MTDFTGLRRYAVLSALTALAVVSGGNSAHAGVVIYTDSQHAATVLDEDTRVVLLDAPDSLQEQIFGKLSADPQEAALAAKAVLQSADWREKESTLAQAYRGVTEAWQLQLSRYPAVVFDDRYVVYGTSDEREARSQFEAWQEANQ